MEPNISRHFWSSRARLLPLTRVSHRYRFPRAEVLAMPDKSTENDKDTNVPTEKKLEDTGKNLRARGRTRGHGGGLEHTEKGSSGRRRAC